MRVLVREHGTQFLRREHLMETRGDINVRPEPSRSECGIRQSVHDSEQSGRNMRRDGGGPQRVALFGSDGFDAAEQPSDDQPRTAPVPDGKRQPGNQQPVKDFVHRREYLVNGNHAEYPDMIATGQQMVEAGAHVMRQDWTGREQDQHASREQHQAAMAALVGAEHPPLSL